MRRIGLLLLTAVLPLLAAAPSDGQFTPPPPTAATPPAVVYLDASAALVDAVVFRRIDETQPFYEVVKDTPSSGMRRTVGTVHGVLVPDPTHGVVDIVFAGTTTADGVGKRPLTRTHTSTVTAVESTYRVTFDARGLYGTRAGAGAGAAITLLDVIDRNGERDSTAANLVRRGFPREKPELEGIVSRRASNRAALEQEMQVNERLATAGQSLGLTWAKGVGLDVAQLQFETCATHLEARLPARHGSPAPSAPPPMPAGADFSLRVSEVFLNGVARTNLGGRTFPLGELRRRADVLLQPLLHDSRPEKERTAALQTLETLLRKLAGKPASITLAQDDPLRFTFAGHTLTVQGHIASIQIDDRTYPGLRLKATYRLVSTAAGVTLERQGPVAVRVSELSPKTDPALLTLVRTTIGLLGGEVLRDRFEVVNLARPQDVRASYADATGGWLTVAWRLAAQPR